MKRLSFVIVFTLLVAGISTPATAQTSADGDAWRALAEKLEGGIAIDLRLRDGKRFKATFIGARANTLVVQRKTRVPVPIEEIPYDSIVSMSKVQSSTSVAKAIGVGVASGAGAIVAMWLIALTALD